VGSAGGGFYGVFEMAFKFNKIKYTFSETVFDIYII
jgi:hypothetical protein